MQISVEIMLGIAFVWLIWLTHRSTQAASRSELKELSEMNARIGGIEARINEMSSLVKSLLDHQIKKEHAL